MPLDFNDAQPQREVGLIPEDTIAQVHLTIRPGNAGEGGWLKRSKSGDSMALDCEFTVVDGPFAKRKFWSLFTLEGTTDGHSKAGEISASRIRAILESARGIRPDDESADAKLGRRLNNWGDLDGLRFIAKIGIEKAREGSGFKDKNTLEAAITPDRKAWAKVEQVKQAATVTTIVAAPSTAPKPNGPAKKPSWAS